MGAEMSMDIWVLGWYPHYITSTTVAPDRVYGWGLLRNGRIIAFVPYRT